MHYSYRTSVIVVSIVSLAYLLFSSFLVGFKSDQVVLVLIFNICFSTLRLSPVSSSWLFHLHCVLDHFRLYEGLP